MSADLYTYRGLVLNVVDGDTVRVDLDLGFAVWLRKQAVRLEGVWAPEAATPEGMVATMIAARILQPALPVIVRTKKAQPRSFTRWIATLHREDGTCLNTEIADALTRNAIPFGGVGYDKKETP